MFIKGTFTIIKSVEELSLIRYQKAHNETDEQSGVL